MTEYTLTINDQSIQFREDGYFRADVEGVETWHPRAALTIWGDDERAAFGIVRTEVPTPVPSVEELCAMIDAERDRRTALDFAYNFGATPAVDDSGAQIAAGERLLQMRPEDRANWQTLQGAALTAVVSGVPETILPMRSEDNWNIQTTAAQVLQVLAAMTANRAALLFHGGALKSQVRLAEDPSSIDIALGWPE